MENLSENAKHVITNANKWTFNGDEKFLHWMKEISQNLENRTIQASQALHELNTNISRTSIALDNAANSLTSLASMQFVENRCQDDDNVTKPSKIGDMNENMQLLKHTPNETIQKFLRNNLHMLYKFHEKFSLDLDDSDDEDNGNNFVYQPKNPYNERLLPHIYGSKPWQENWHVGLRDDINNFSGDENEEEFSESESSSSGLTENIGSSRTTSESISKDGLTVDFVTEASLPNTQTFSPSVETHKIPFADPCQYKQVDLFDFNDKTSSVTLTPSTTPKVNRNLTADPRVPDTPPLIPSASEDSLKRKTVNLFDDDDFNSFMAEITENVTKPMETPIAVARQTTPPVSKTVYPSSDKEAIRRKSHELFDNPIEVITSSNRSQNIPNSQKPILDLNKAKPKNLFDSPDEISSDKPLSSDETCVKIHLNNPIHNELIKERRNKLSTHSMEVAAPSNSTQAISKMPKESPDFDKQKSSNLFESPDGQPSDKPLFSYTIKSTETDKTKLGKTMITAKSLFDDDDDDDDFLNVFGKKQILLQKPTNRLTLFDDDLGIGDINLESPVTQNKEVDKDTNANVAKKIQKPNDQLTLFDDDLGIGDIPTTKLNLESPLTQSKENDKVTQANAAERINLFDDDKEAAFDFNAMRKTSLIKDKSIEVLGNINQQINKTKLPDSDGLSKNNQHETDALTHIDRFQKNSLFPEKNNISNKNSKASTYVDKQTENENVYGPSFEERVDIEAVSSDSCEERKPNLSQGENVTLSSNQQYSTLFLDEPPDDDEFFQSLASKTTSLTKSALDIEADFYEPALPKVPEKCSKAESHLVESKNSSNLMKNYGGLLGIFNDVPPDDDDVDFRVEPSTVSDVNNKLHNVFYDDLKETMEAMKIVNRHHISTHNFFDDEPPQDDEGSSTSEKLVKAETLSHQFRQDQSLDSVEGNSNNRESHEFFDVLTQNAKLPRSDTPIQSTGSPKVGKLNMAKININVHALLPNADGELCYKKPPESIKTSLTQEENQNTIESITVPISNKVQNILPNICKTRVRIPVKRRPSTRRGRQESYQKSLLVQQQDIEEPLEKHLQQKNDQFTVQSANPSEVVPKSINTLQADQLPPLQTEIPISISFSDNFPDNEVSMENVDFLLNRNVLSKTSMNTDLLETENESATVLPKIVGEKSSEVNPSILVVSEILNKSSTESFLSNLSEEAPNDSGLFNFSSGDREKMTTTSMENVEKDEDPLFYDCRSISTAEQIEQSRYHSGNVYPSNKHQIKEAEVVQIPISVASVPIQQTPLQSKEKDNTQTPIKLFDESNDEEDDLFGTTSVIAKATKNTQSIITSKYDRLKLIPDEKPLSPKLFEDVQIDSDDDLFKNSIVTKDQTAGGVTLNVPTKPNNSDDKFVQKPVIKKSASVVQKNESLFGSDNDSDDEFLSALKNIEKKKKTIKENKSLFSDIDSDDDNDLFGGSAGGKKRIKNVKEKSQPRKLQSHEVLNTKSDNSLEQSSADADNPLADLLNN